MVLLQRFFALITLKARLASCLRHVSGGKPLVQRFLGLKRLPDMAVPFERFVELKGIIERRRAWWPLGVDRWGFPLWWKPKAWNHSFRFVFVRTRVKKQSKGPIQLDLFVPHEYGYEFKVILTNKALSIAKVVAYHEGRGSQEGIFAELKTHCQAGYVPVRTCLGNPMYLLAGILAHNLMREFQMLTTPRCRGTTEKRTALWAFERLDTLRDTLLRRAGRITRPQGKLTLTIGACSWIKNRLLQCLVALDNAA